MPRALQTQLQDLLKTMCNCELKDPPKRIVRMFSLVHFLLGAGNFHLPC
jgi:hypothetical protein